jgi:putative BNR repeat neuraminidase
MKHFFAGLLLVAAGVCMGQTTLDDLAKADGYRGIWYANQRLDNEYVYKYSGGLGTYCAKHIPMAVYAPAVNKTFFVYGGTSPDRRNLLEMVAFYDHATGEVPRPTLLLDKQTEDAHDNPVIALDDAGHVWVFASAHGTSRPAYIYKSRKPYDVAAFDLVLERNFSYPQPWYLAGKGFLFLHTRYAGGRVLYWMTSRDGMTWSEGEPLAKIEQGHYQVSWPWGDKVGTAFNHHPQKGGLNYRTNLYYVESDDLGATWRTVTGETVATPLTSSDNPALVRDYAAEGLLAYMKDLNFDADGRPAILHVTSKGFESGPANGPREWRIAHWTGAEWVFRTVTASDNNYDTGSLHVEGDGTWRVIGPTETGPQPYNPGGEVAMWVSRDAGVSWERERVLTGASAYNHTYVRRPLNAAPGFYAYWADGHGRQPSPSRLYFATKDGEVCRLPETMKGDMAVPEQVAVP